MIIVQAPNSLLSRDGSRADSPAASNYAGVRDPVVDELVELLINAPDRESLVARSRALDRVLLFGYYVIPQWHLRMQRVLYWDKFSRPTVTPRAGTSTDYWWFDDAKAARLESARKSQPENSKEGAGNESGLIKLLGILVAAGIAGTVILQRRRRARRSQ